jgi:hypothetical protein
MKTKTLTSAVVCTVSNQHKFKICTVYGISGNIRKNEKAV